MERYCEQFVVVCKISNFNPMKIFPLRLSRRKSLQPTEVLSSTTLTQEIRLQVQMTIVGIKCKWRQNGSNKWNMKLKKGKMQALRLEVQPVL